MADEKKDVFDTNVLRELLGEVTKPAELSFEDRALVERARHQVRAVAVMAGPSPETAEVLDMIELAVPEAESRAVLGDRLDAATWAVGLTCKSLEIVDVECPAHVVMREVVDELAALGFDDY